MNIDALMEELDNCGVATEDAIERVGSKEDYLKYLQEFVQNPYITDLENAVAAHSALDGEHAVHTLKGNALTLGLLPFSDVCFDMLTEYRSGAPEKAEQQLDAVLESFEELKELIEQVD